MQTAANDAPEQSETLVSNSAKTVFHHLEISEPDLITLLCALEDSLAWPISRSGSIWTHQGIRDASELLSRLHILALGRKPDPIQWTPKARQAWKSANLKVRHILGLPDPLPLEDFPPL